MKRTGRTVWLAVVFSLALGDATRAESPHVGVLAFVGSMIVMPGQGLPLLDEPSPSYAEWSLSNWGNLPNIGLGLTTDGDAGSARINASGLLHVGFVNTFGSGPYCGLSGGSRGTGEINFVTTWLRLDEFAWAQSAATVVVFTADTLDYNSGEYIGGLAGVASAVPPVASIISSGTGDCRDGTAVQFWTVGAGAVTYTVGL